MKTFTLKQNLIKHKKYRCSRAKNLTPMELQERRKQEDLNVSVQDVEYKDLTSTTYKEDKEMEEFLGTVPSAYARFRLCENKKNPMSLPGFWPALFEYRGKLALSDIEAKIRAKDGWKTLASILTDAYLYHGVDAITFRKAAFIETEEGDIFNISDYRVPRSHCKVNTDAQMRLDQPRFDIIESQYCVTIALHPRFIALLPSPIYSKPQEHAEHIMISVQDNCEEEDDFGIKDLLEGNASSESLDEIFSQEFSQVSLEDPCLSPVFKKQKIEIQVPSSKIKLEEKVEDETYCPHCKVYKNSDKSKITRHIRLYCHKSPDLDALEASRRQKREHNRTVKKQEIDQEKSEKDVPKEVNPIVPVGGDCGCRGRQHLPDCLRLRGGAGRQGFRKNIIFSSAARRVYQSQLCPS